MTYDWIKYYPDTDFQNESIIDVQSIEYSIAFLKSDSIEAHYWNQNADYLTDPWSTVKF